MIVPHEQCSLPAGFIFAHQFDDAGRFLFFFFSLFSGQTLSDGCYELTSAFDPANINCNSTELKETTYLCIA